VDETHEKEADQCRQDIQNDPSDYRRKHEREENDCITCTSCCRGDAVDFFAFASTANLHTETAVYDLARLKEAFADLREGRSRGATVLVP
jgi:D-arabinose 1-dehydrogenase-like Zn-dependent alcohol dehydrogenase